MTIDKGLLVTLLYCGAFLVWTLLSRQDTQTQNWISDVVSLVTAMVGGGLCIRGTLGVQRGKWSAGFLTLGVIGYGVGSALWAFYEVGLREPPFPSWADAGFTTSFVASIIGIVLLPGRPYPTLVRVRVLFDSLMVLASLVTFSWFFILGPTILSAKGSFLSKLLGTAYPCFDLAMLFCILVLAGNAQDRMMARVRNLLCAGILSYVLSDVWFGYGNLKGVYHSGNPCDVGWMLANLFIGLALLTLRKAGAGSATESSKEFGSRPTLGRSLLPYFLVPAVAALLFYVWHTNVASGLATGVYIGSATLVGLIMVRQVFSIAENVRLNRYLQAAYRELEALATIDGMTGLPNHRVFQERLRKEMESGATVSLLIIDVDRFKDYNDAFGHPAGDDALRIVAGLIRSAVRDSDLPARYGGEEFAAILPRTDLPAALAIAERIRSASEAHFFPHRSVTLSIGVAAAASCLPGALIGRADRALYAAKRGGRNRVAFEDDALAFEIVNPSEPLAPPGERGRGEGKAASRTLTQ